MFEDMVDELRDAVGVLTSDIPRLLSIFLIAGFITGALIVVNLAPNYTGYVKNPDLAYCGNPNYPILSQSIIYVPIATYFSNPPLSQAEVDCPIYSGNYLLVGLYYAEISATLLIIVFLGILFLHLDG